MQSSIKQSYPKYQCTSIGLFYLAFYILCNYVAMNAYQICIYCVKMRKSSEENKAVPYSMCKRNDAVTFEENNA